MEKEQRNRLQKATQDARKLLEEEFRSQLLQTYDIDVDKVRWAEEPGTHLQAEQRLIRAKLVAWIEHKEAQINDRKEALLLALREMAFTALNRFVALKLMEARELVRPCVTGGLESAGFLEFTAVAQGLLADQESSYRLYLETIFEDVSRELRALFDPRDPASLLWPKRAALLELLDILNRPELAELWSEDETLGWVYQYFNGDAERRKMRDESPSPRNSRELAVRNQFFTPRYVVEFLTDNTLGRIWYEMRQGNTGLKDRCRYLVRRPNEVWMQPGEEPPAQADADETLSQEELLRQPVYIPHRSPKDPREIRMLDPACGSMHFGLYAFDLYLEIYKEAWEIAQGSDEQSKQEEAFSPFVAYAAGFADKAAFLREVPRLILQHNIHGIDIDPRATQIARLTLWLRAQRAWQEQQLQVADRPPITRSNVVCAEPMPGERELLADFVDDQFHETERGLVQQLLEAIFDKMQVVGEAGSLLKIEEEIREAIDQARREWQKLAVQQRDLFSPADLAALGQVATSLNKDLQSLTKDFWVDIEERIYAALRDYAEHAEYGKGYQRRLFAEDAARGFAFIDICRKRYDAVVMNPPFGNPVDSTASHLELMYPDAKHDVALAMVEGTVGRLAIGGQIGAITTRTPLFNSSSANWRQNLIFAEQSLSACLDLGGGVLDAMVEVAAYVIDQSLDCSFPLFIQLTTEPPESKNNAAAIEIRRTTAAQASERVFVRKLSDLRSLPNSPLAYWLPSSLVRCFNEYAPLQRSGAEAWVGLQTSKDDRFLRTWWEIALGRDGWIPFAKGGEASPYLADIHLVINWQQGGHEMKAYHDWLNQIGKSTPGNGPRRDFPFYFQHGLTWVYRTDRFHVQPLPTGCITSTRGPGIYSESKIEFMLGYLNSIVADVLIKVLLGKHKQPQFDIDDVNAIPTPELVDPELGKLGTRAWTLRMQNFIGNEEFAQGCASQLIAEASSSSLAEVTGKALVRYSHSLEQLTEIQEQIDSRANALLDINDEDIDRISSLLFPWRDFGLQQPEINQVASQSVSFLVGSIFGRWDIRYATCERQLPELPDPFDPLPVCPPGMLQNAEGLPAALKDVPADYPLRISWPGILVDDENHSEDIVARVREAIAVIWKDRVRAIEQEACDILGVQTLRELFRRPAAFFSEHLKRYSKSRRQAPIYWHLSAGSGSYSVWLYYHRFTQDTLYRLLGDFVEPRIQEAEREQFELESQGVLSGDGASLLQEAQTLLQDLRLFKSELELVAPLWNPNLNDGVIINHAILWRITPYTPWQKKCKECWDKLVKGDYDWAQLAFHLWPERVIRKCTTDRSLAIAHGLEERLWQETNNAKWLPRQLSEADLQALVAEHSNQAVKNALERFLAAPPPVAPTRTRASRSTRSSGSSTPKRARGSAAVVDAEATRQVLLALTAAPSDGLAKTQIADLIGVEAKTLTAVIKQLKESGQIDQLGERRGARYLLSEQGRAAVASQAGEED